MPNIKEYGERMASSSQDPRKVTSAPGTKAAVPPIQYDRFCRNGKHPSAHLWNQLHEATNQAVLYRTRELFHATGLVGAAPTGGASHTRWRFAFRTGPYGHAIKVTAAMIPPDVNPSTNTYARLIVYSDTAEAVTVGNLYLYHGVNPGGTGGTSEGLPYIKTLNGYISGLTANTNYYARFDEEYGRILSASVCEFQTLTENGGYLAQNITAQTDIYDAYREYVATMQKNLLKYTGGLALNLATGATASTNATNTSKNIADGFGTTFTEADPCFKLDLRYRDRLAQTSGIPVVMKVFCSSTVGPGVGRIYLKNSAGTAVMTITDSIPSPSPGWLSTTGFLPATEERYYPHFDNNGSGTLSVYAVSVYEYET